MNTLNHLINKIEKINENLLVELEHIDYLYNSNMDNLDWDFLSLCYPKAERCHNLLNPHYISTLKEYKFIWDSKFILCRDGFMPLVNFFQIYKRASGIETILLIHEELDFLIPESWKNNVVLYRLEAHNTFYSLDKLDQILFFQTASNADCSSTRLKQEISNLKELLNGDTSKVKVHSYLRGNPFYEPRAEVVHESYDMIRQLLIEFGQDIEFHRWSDVQRIRNYQATGFYSADQGVFVHGFSYIDDYLLRKGSINIDGRFDKKRSSKDERRINVSPGHSIVLSNLQNEDYSFWDEFNRFSNYCKYSTSIYKSDMFRFLSDYAKEKSIVV